MLWRRPGSQAAPEKRWLCRSVRAVVTGPWLAQCASNPQLAHPADGLEYNTQVVAAGFHSDSLVYDQTAILADLPPPLIASGETAFYVKGCCSFKM